VSRPWIAVAVAAVALALWGCAGKARVSQDVPPPAPVSEGRLDRTGSELREPARTESSSAADQHQLGEQVSRIAGELNDLQNAVAKVIASSRRQEGQLQALERRVAELATRSRDGVGSVPEGFAPSSTPTAPAPGSSTSTAPADDLYRTGMARFRAGELDAAVLVFYELILNHPTHPLRATAQFQVADIFYSQKDLRGALLEFEGLAAAVPNGARTPDALVKIGLCHRGLGDEKQARAAWERVTQEYPNSAAARQAQTLLRSSRSG
jgi:TolA-binding protein